MTFPRLRGTPAGPFWRLVLAGAAAVLAAGCAPAPWYVKKQQASRQAPRPAVAASVIVPVEPAPRPSGRSTTGVASYYGPGFHHGKTASGERFDMYELTAAHRTLPFGTRVKVTNLDNGKSVVVRINDRGPFKKSRIIDLSLGAAKKIGMTAAGTAKVRVEVLR